MKIKRMIHGEEVEIELTHDELYLAYEAYEHHCDYEYVKNQLEGGALAEDMQHALSDKQWDQLIHEIAWEKRRQQDKYEYDENDALDKAEEHARRKILPDWPKKRYFQIRIANADENNVVHPIASVYCWSFEKPSKEDAAEFAIRSGTASFDEVFDITEIPIDEIDEWFDNPSEVPALNQEA